MTADAPERDSRPRLHPDFVRNLVRTFDDSDEHGVHLFFKCRRISSTR